MSVTEGDIRRLEAEVAELRRENSRMEGEIRAMTNSLDRAGGIVSSAESEAIGALVNGENTLTTDDNTLQNVGRVGDDIRARMVLYKNIENAYKTIRRLNNDLRYHQGNEKTVRRMLAAMLDNESKAFASEETVRTQSEKLYLDTQFYFLSHIMMDLQLRKAGETAAADRARKKALEMDERKSVWVYFMIALKRGDRPEKSKWLKKLMTVAPVGSEKELIRVLALLALQPKNEDAAAIAEYIGLDKIGAIDKGEIVGAILKSYRAAMTVVPPKFENIDKHVAEAGALGTALRGAMNNEEVGAYVKKLATDTGGKMRNDIIDAMLDNVIESCHSPRAQEIYDEIAYQEKIIEAKGVIEDAMALKAREEVEKVSDIDIESCLFEWLNEKDRYNGKKEIVEFAYGKFKPSFRHAYDGYVKQYRAEYKDEVTVTVGEYRTRTKLNDLEKEDADIKAHCASVRDAEKARITNAKFILLTVFGGILLVAGIVMNFLSDFVGGTVSVLALAAGVAAGLVLLILGAVTKYKNYKRKLAADAKCERDIADYTQIMHGVFADVQAYRGMYAEYDAKVLSSDFF